MQHCHMKLHLAASKTETFWGHPAPCWVKAGSTNFILVTNDSFCFTAAGPDMYAVYNAWQRTTILFLTYRNPWFLTKAPTSS